MPPALGEPAGGFGAAPARADGAAVGFYGKLPARGDFVTRRLPKGFVDAWDAWLQDGISESRAQLGEGWLNAWLEGPIWRFVVAAGVAGDQAVAGVMMPSVDRAGRYFPLTLASCLAGEPALLACAASEQWFGALEAAGLGALSPDADLPALEAQVAQLPPLPADRLTDPAAWGDGALRFDLAADAGGAAAVLAAAYPNPALAGRCLFWTYGAQRVQPALLLLPALPPASHFAALLDDSAAPVDAFAGPAAGPALAPMPPPDPDLFGADGAPAAAGAPALAPLAPPDPGLFGAAGAPAAADAPALGPLPPPDPELFGGPPRS